MDHDQNLEGDVTSILRALEEGDAAAPSSLLLLIYDELHRRAHRHMRHQDGDHTLETTALVHDAYQKIFGNENRRRFENREHFYATASMVMRDILVSHARKKESLKRLPKSKRVPIEAMIDRFERNTGDLGRLSDAITELSEKDARQGKIVVMYNFGGLSQKQIAEAMGISVSTVYREIQTAILILRSMMDE